MNKRLHTLYILFISIFPLYIIASEEPKTDLLTLSGYINYKAFYDTRQVVGIDDNQTLFYPKKKIITPTGDINAKGEGQMLPIETRMRATLFGPDIRENVHEFGVIEVEFRGTREIVNLVNMRHAYAQLDWDNVSCLFGQTWHPLNVIELQPNTVSFNSGRPFAVYNRSPQLNFTYHAPSVDIILSAASQVDFTSDGPIGLSPTYMSNAVVPNLHFQLKGFFGDHIAGAGIDYQRIAPRLASDTGYKVRENISSLVGTWYLGLFWPKLEIRNTIMFGGNISNYGIIGGYALKAHSTNPVTGKQHYTNTRTFTVWSDVTYTPTDTFETGFFIGVAKNCGSADTIALPAVYEQNIFGLGNDLNTVFRISPRIRFKIKQVTFAGEVEYTRAAYGTITHHAKVVDVVPVANTQLLFSSFFFF